MKNTRQTTLTHWLKSQSQLAKPWVRLSSLLGVISGLLIVGQAWIMATLLHAFIIEHADRELYLSHFIALLTLFFVRALITWLRERIGYKCGQIIRQHMRSMVIEKLNSLGPAWIKGKPVGSWATLLVEQIEDMQDYYSRYLPQMALSMFIPLIILITIFPMNWAAGLILLFTAPLIPLFMALVGMGAADANRRNFVVLARLSGHFLDRLRGLETLRLFNRAQHEKDEITEASNNFRKRTMEVLRLAFLSSSVLEFFTSVSIAVVAVYFGFNYLNVLNFGSYGIPITLFSGFLALILAPEFFQPLRDLGTFYHAKAQAIGAADAIDEFLNAQADAIVVGGGELTLNDEFPLTLCAKELYILSPQGTQLAGPLTFNVTEKQRIALVGLSGAGKSSLLNALLGFLPYQGSLTINGIELNQLKQDAWRQKLAWVGQNPQLPASTLRQNILLGSPNASEDALQNAIIRSHVAEFLPQLPQGLETLLGDHAARLSVGQAQRIAVARALLSPCHLLLLDEPTASLDALSEHLVMQALEEASHKQTTLLVTHQLEETRVCDEIWVMDKGLIVQRGNYADLAAQKGLFADLINARQEEL